jgi:hypothetical protein
MPTALGYDFYTQVRLIEEKWRKYFPLIEYSPLLISPLLPASNSVVAGAVNTSQIDPLYMETINIAKDGAWKQPHASASPVVSPITDASDVFGEAVSINARIRREANDLELKKWGFDEMRDLIVTIPCSLFDTAEIQARPGDKFTWDGEPYTVLQRTRDGYWKNSNIRFYVVMNCEKRRAGS